MTWKIEAVVENDTNEVSTELLTITTPTGKVWIVDKTTDPRLFALAQVFAEFQKDPPVFTVCAGKLEVDDGEVYTNWKYISAPMVLAAALEDLKTVKDYPVSRIECNDFVIEAEHRSINGD